MNDDGLVTVTINGPPLLPPGVVVEVSGERNEREDIVEVAQDTAKLVNRSVRGVEGEETTQPDCDEEAGTAVPHPPFNHSRKVY